MEQVIDTGENVDYVTFVPDGEPTLDQNLGAMIRGIRPVGLSGEWSDLVFTDARSKRVVIIAHCVLNQNSISDGTADHAGADTPVVNLLLRSDVGILQMPCPEMLCLGLDRRDIQGGERPILVENSRIRNLLSEEAAMQITKILVDQIVFQVEEYCRYGFSILSIIGIDRSPSCGVNTTSIDNREVEGEGVFIKALHQELQRRNIQINMIGIKGLETEKALSSIRQMLGL